MNKYFVDHIRFLLSLLHEKQVKNKGIFLLLTVAKDIDLDKMTFIH